MAFIKKRRWTRKPSKRIELDRSHPLAGNMVAAYIFNEQSGIPVNLVKGLNSTVASTTAPAFTIRNGVPVLDFGTDARHITIGRDEDTLKLGGVNEFSIAWSFVRTASGGADEETLISNLASPSNNNMQLLFRYDSDTSRWECSVRETGNWISSGFGAAQALNDKRVDVFTYDGTCHFYSDGVSFANLAEEGTGNPVSSSAANVDTTIGNSTPGVATDYWRGYGVFMYVWRNRALTQAEAESLSKNPYQILKPQNIYLPTGVVSAGATLHQTTNYQGMNRMNGAMRS